MKTRRLLCPVPLDLRATLAPLRHGPADPTIRLTARTAQLASRTPQGPAVLDIRLSSGEITGSAWGTGATWALDNLPALVGLHDRPQELVSRHDVVRHVQRRNPGRRMCRSGMVMDSLIPTVLGQRVTSGEAHRSFRLLTYRFGAAAPGSLGLRLPPDPQALTTVPYHELHPFGIERARADILRRACSRSGRLQEAAEMEPRLAEKRLQAIPGIGPWTSACVVQSVHGDPDAVIIGDYHLPNIVAWALAGEPRADDRRMLELLRPYAGQRGRVVGMLKSSGLRPPKYGPRHRVRDLAGS